MKLLKTSLLSMLMFMICITVFAGVKDPGKAISGIPDLEAATAVVYPQNTFRAMLADTGFYRQVENVGITVDGSSLILTWNEVAGAISYKVYSSSSPDTGYAEDTSGSFDGLSWSAPVPDTDACRFYYIVSVSPDSSGSFVNVPGGTFIMGDTRGVGYSDELPTHSVTLSSFYIGEYEVTQAEYSQYMQPAASWTSSLGLGDTYPAYYVSWYAILKYCNLRSIAEGLTPCYTISGSTNPAAWGAVPAYSNATWDAAICNWSANGYRLPTEAEWEYAARGATNNPDYLYSGSDDVGSVAWYIGNNTPNGTKSVGTKAPNGIGTHDMSGNLLEWCWDWYGSYSSAPQTNPTGPSSGAYPFRLLRGGYWNITATGCRVSVRTSTTRTSLTTPSDFVSARL
jgi:formylglycine-generating enzyme required for sulfatase activity